MAGLSGEAILYGDRFCTVTPKINRRSSIGVHTLAFQANFYLGHPLDSDQAILGVTIPLSLSMIFAVAELFSRSN